MVHRIDPEPQMHSLAPTASSVFNQDVIKICIIHSFICKIEQQRDSSLVHTTQYAKLWLVAKAQSPLAQSGPSSAKDLGLYHWGQEEILCACLDVPIKKRLPA